MSRATRVLLQRQYDMCPEAVERHLCKLQNEKPTNERYKELVDDLHTQIYDVPAKLYRRLVCSLPLELMVENHWGLKEQHERDRREKINLRAQVRILTRDNQDLRKQLATYQELELEIELLNDQFAAYRRLRMAVTSAYVSIDSIDQ
ncbi:hypothetical protein ABVT39_008329 [Epinephelus coioides]